MESGGIAAFTLVQVLLEKLVERGALNQEDAFAVVDQSIYLNRRVIPEASGHQNSDTAYLLEQLRNSLSLVFHDQQSKEK